MRPSHVLVLAAVGLLAPGPSALAAANDVSLTAFLGQGDDSHDYAGFDQLSRELGLAMQPRFGGPAATLGSRGFDFAYNLATTAVNAGDAHWTKAVDDPVTSLRASQLHVRKGLPYSFELGGTVTRLHELDLWAIGFEAKWAFVEGYRLAPSVGMRTHVSTILGSRDLGMLCAGMDATIGKAFGIGGLVQVTPYLGYALSYVQSRSHVLGTFEPGHVKLKTAIIDPRHLVDHRTLVGLTLVASAIELGFEGAIGDVDTYTLRVGLNF